MLSDLGIQQSAEASSYSSDPALKFYDMGLAEDKGVREVGQGQLDDQL